jgi:hypothetical protein
VLVLLWGGAVGLLRGHGTAERGWVAGRLTGVDHEQGESSHDEGDDQTSGTPAQPRADRL